MQSSATAKCWTRKWATLATTGIAQTFKKGLSAGKHLLGLINDILDLSKIEAGKMELYLEEFDLKSVIGEVASMVQPLIAQHENTFVLTGSDEIRLVRLDLTKVRQILFNLISNASKFTQNGTISLEATPVPGDAVSRPAIRFRVSDTGIGITKEQEERLFKEFAQADGSTTRKFGGTGLGLAISKRFCEMMCGSIGIESSSSKGTTFVATLPQRIEEARGSAGSCGTNNDCRGQSRPEEIVHPHYRR